MIEEMNKRLRNFSVWDIGLTKATVFFFAIAIVKYFPVLLLIRYRVLMILVILTAIKPLYRFIANK